MFRFATLLFALVLVSGSAAAAPEPQPAAPLTAEAIGELSLDELLAELPLRAGTGPGRAVEAEIVRRWHRSGSDTADLMFSWAMKAIEDKNFSLALDILDQVILVKPDFAEAWNKRATVHYMLDDYSSSLSDLREALAIEPRHFGALAGLGILLEASGRKERALTALRRALEINPQLEKVRKSLERLERETSGQSI